MKYSLPLVTALLFVANIAEVQAACDNDHCYSGFSLIINNESYYAKDDGNVASNLPPATYDYDQEKRMYAYNYKSFEMTGGSLSLERFKIRNYLDAIISGGTVTLENAGLKAKNANLNISGGTFKATSSEVDGKYVTISNKANITLNNAGINALDTMNILGGTVSLSSAGLGTEGINLNISGGTINLTNAQLYATPETIGTQPVITISGGTINLNGGAYINSSSVEYFDDFERHTASAGNITGGIINVKGKNGMVMHNPNFGGTLNLAQSSTFSVWESYDDNDDDDLAFNTKGTLNTTATGNINLNGGRLKANVSGNGKINVKSSSSVIDGDVDGADFVITVNTTLSQLIEGNIISLGNIDLQKGILTVDKLPIDEDSAAASFTMEKNTTLKGIGMVTNGEINIKGGTINVNDAIGIESKNCKYSDNAADMNISGGNITVTTNVDDDDKEEAGEIRITGNGDMNISGTATSTVINMNFSNVEIPYYEDGHDGGILHEGKTGDINISGGTINLTGKVAKIERGGYDGDWIYDNEGNALMDWDEFHNRTGKYLNEPSVNNQDIIDAGLNPETVDRDQYHISEGDINISGGAINLKDGARIAATYENTGDIVISGGTIKTIKNAEYKGDYGRILHYGSGDIIISGNAVINMEKGDIQKGNHRDDSERTKGNIEISGNANITAFNDTHINSDQDVIVSGGTITLYNDATLEGYGDFIVSGGNITVGKMTETPCWECDTWSAIGSHYKDGNVLITGGNITLNNNSSLDRSTHIDDDMDIGQLKGAISGNMTITGGTVTANGNSVILLGWGDGDDINENSLADMIDSGEVTETGDIIIGGDTVVTLNNDASIIHDAIGEIKITGGTLNMNGNSELRAEHDGVINMTGGELNLGGQAQIYTDNKFHNPVAMNVSDGAIVNVTGNNLINNNISMDNTAQLNIASGATFNLKRYNNTGLITMNGKAGIDLQGTLNANIDGNHNSILLLKGTNAKLGGNATDLAALDFEDAKTSFANQNLSADSITLSNSTLSFNGNVIMQSLDDDIVLSDNSLIKVTRGNNSITSAHDIVLNDSDLEIKSGASLDLNVGEDGHVRFNGGNIYLLGTLSGNVQAEGVFIGDGGIIESGRYDTAEISGKTGNVSAFVTDKLNVGNLIISDKSNITLDRANTLVVDEDKRQYAYETGTYKGKRYTLMEDQNEFVDEKGDIDYSEIDDDAVLKTYENQIYGTLKINDSTLNLKTNLAADKFVLNNNAVLNAQNQIIGGKSLLVDNNSTANLQHTSAYTWNESGFSDSVVVDHNSVLNITTFDIGSSWNMTDYIKILNGSTLNLIDDGFHAAEFLVDNSSLIAKNADFGAKHNDGNPASVFNHAVLDMDNSYSYTHGITGLYQNTTATLADKSTLAANEMEIENSTVTANNSHVGAFKRAVKIDMEDSTIYNNIDHGLFLADQTDLNISDSTITLNGNSELGAAMAIDEEDDDDNDHIVGYLTPEMLQNPELLKQLNSKYKDYTLSSHQNYNEDHEYDFNDGFQDAADYKAQVNISGSDITLNDTAKIVNAMLNIDKEGDGSGDVIISDGSNVEVNGNNTISASHKVRVYDSTIVVNNDATLNIKSSQIKAEDEDKDISTQKIVLSDSTIELNGTLNADVEGKNEAVLQISGKAVLNGNAEELSKIEFNDAQTSLKDQSLSAEDIILNGSTVNIKGGVSLLADNSLKLNSGSVLNVSGLENEIYAEVSVELKDSIINIKRNSQLNFEVGSDGYVKLDNSFINVYEGSNLSGNIREVSRITLNGGAIKDVTGPSVSEDQIVSGEIYKLSSVIGDTIINLGDLYISNSKNMNIDKDGMFKLSEDDGDYVRKYEVGYEGNKKYYADATVQNDDEESADEGKEIIPYENQIIGTLNIKDSNITSSTNFAAGDVVIDNSTFSATDRILGASSLHVTNGSKVNLLSKSLLTLSGFDNSVNVDGGSTLTTNYFQVGIEDSQNETTAEFNISDNSTYNISNGEAYTGLMNVTDNSTVNATNSHLRTAGNAMTFSASKLNATGSFVQTGNVYILADADTETGSVINLKANSAVTAENTAEISKSTVVADNSDIGIFNNAIKISVTDKELTNRMHPMNYDYYTPATLNINNSKITLNGTSRLGAGLAIVNWKTGTQGVIEGFITRDLYENPEKFMNDKRFAGYELEDFDNGFEYATGYQSIVNIDNSTITMDGSSAIVNAVLNTENGSGNIVISNSSVNVKGKNATISAANDINLTDSTLSILRGAVLNIASDTASNQLNQNIYLNNTSLNLAGLIKGNIILDGDSNFILNGGRIEGKVDGLSSLSLGADQSGKTSVTMKGMKIEGINTLTLAGEQTASGKVVAPNITLDSAVFTVDNEDANRKYYAYDTKAKGYLNLGTWEYAQNYENNDRYEIHAFDNQINGDVDLSGGATLTLNSAFAADNFNLKGATLNVSNARIDGNLYLDEKSTANINGGKTSDVSLGNVEVNDNSTLNLNSIDWIGIASLSADNSKLNLNGTDLDSSGAVTLNNTTTNLTSSIMWERDENGDHTSISVNGGTLNATASQIGFFNTSTDGAKITASRGSLMAVGNADILNGTTINLNDTSKIITGEYDDEDAENKAEYLSDFTNFYANNKADMNFSDSKLNLNGSSTVNLAIADNIEVALHGNIVFDNSEVTMTGTSQILNSAIADDIESTSGYIIFREGSVLNVNGKNNTLSATNMADMHGSTLNIAKGATLSVKSTSPHEEYANTLHVIGSNIVLAGILDANLSIEDDEESEEKTSLTMNGGRVAGKIIGLNDLALGNGQSGKTSVTLKGTEFENIKGLTIAGTTTNGRTTAPNIVLDSAVFSVSDNPRKYGYDEVEKMYFDLGTDYADYYDEQPEFAVKEFDNQILGDVNISNRATLTVNKALAAENIIVNNATLISNNGLLHGNLDISNNSVATINGSMLDLIIENINVDTSTLNLNSLEYMKTAGISLVNAKLNTSKYAEIDIEDIENSGTLEAIDSTINIGAGGSWISANRALVQGGTINIVDADVRFADTLMDSAEITVSKNTIFGLGNAAVENSKITLNDKSRLVTDFINVSQDYFSGELDLNDYDAYPSIAENSPIRNSVMEFSKTTLNLNGSSSVERNVVFENADSTGRGEVLPGTVLGMQGDILFDQGAVVNMNGTSAINNMADAGNIIFDQSSLLNVKGRNTVSADGDVEFDDYSTIDVAQGATLTVSDHDNSIHLDNARIKLAGTLNANLSGTISSFIYGAKGNLNGTIELSDTIKSFGVSGANTRTLSTLLTRFSTTDMETFEITDKSNLNYDDALEEKLSFENLKVENSTLGIFSLRNLTGDLTANSGSTVKINNGTNLTANSIDLQDSSLTVAGAALKKGQTDYQTNIITTDGISVDNTNNTKATVTISNVNISGDLQLNNVNKATLTNIVANGYDVTIAGDVTQDKKGNNIYKTATLTNVSADNLNIDGTKTTLQNNSFDNINVYGEGYADIKGNLTASLALSENATAALAANKRLIGNVLLDDDGLFSVQGTVEGNISTGVTETGTLQIANNKAQIIGNVSGVNLDLLKLRTSLSNIFKSDVNSIASTRLNNSTITADYIDDFGSLELIKSSLILKNDISANDLYANASTLNLGTNILTVAGNASLANGTNINIQVDSKDEYGHIDVSGTLLLASDARGNKPSTNLAITLKKGIVLSADDSFNFLNYEDVDGQLNRVTIANNRYTFEEQEVGQFVITNATSGKGVITRYNPNMRNAMRAATALVDNNQPLSGNQSQLAENLNTLSQIEGGENNYIQALNATNPDDNNMVSENTIDTVNTVLGAVSDQTSSAGISSSAQGMSSGDALSGMSLWTKVLYNQGKLDNTAAFDGFKSRMRGLAMGGDKKLNKDVKLGLGYAYTKGKITNGYRRSDVDTHTAMLYGEYKPSAWFVNAFAGYGWSDYENKAYSALGRTKSDFDVYAATLQLNTGYDINVAKDTVLTPVAGMRYTHIAREAYTDSDDKRISKNNSNIVTALAGAKLKKTFALDNGAYLTPEARFGFTYDVKRDADNSVVKLSNGSSYEVEGRALNRFAVEAGAGITAAFDNGIELTAGYEGRFRKDYRDHTGLLDCRYNF